MFPAPAKGADRFWCTRLGDDRYEIGWVEHGFSHREGYNATLHRHYADEKVAQVFCRRYGVEFPGPP